MAPGSQRKRSNGVEDGTNFNEPTAQASNTQSSAVSLAPAKKRQRVDRQANSDNRDGEEPEDEKMGEVNEHSDQREKNHTQEEKSQGEEALSDEDQDIEVQEDENPGGENNDEDSPSDDEDLHYDHQEDEDDDADNEDDFEEEVDGDPTSKVFKDKFKWKSGLDNGKPLDTIEKMFEHMLEVMNDDKGFNNLLNSGKVLRIGTMCSGTECPIIAMEFIAELLAKKDKTLQHEHAFSAEIVPFKQAYIQRNWPKVTIFRDVVEFAYAVDSSFQTSGKRRRGAQPYQYRKATTSYGDQVDIPSGKLDMLVAGFSCVDFSVLNGRKRTLEERGESGDTLYSIVDFVRSERPKLVLLENVKNAPWSDEKVQKHNRKKLIMEIRRNCKKNKMKAKETEEAIADDEVDRILKERVENNLTNRGIDALMEEIGYACQLVLLDAKDFFIPQTRQRGYMLCVDTELFGEDEAAAAMTKAKNSLKQWGHKLKSKKQGEGKGETSHRLGGKLGKLEHQASVAAEQILLAASEDTTISITRIEESEKGKKKVIKWPSVKLKHEQYREDLGLGDERKLTHWNEADYKHLPDFWTPMAGMTQRVLDSLEISHLRNIIRGMDDTCYSRLLELSQSVYRTVDTTAAGIIPCLTPNGMPWWTSDGRRVRGREALLLQGLPVQRMDLSYLTEANLQDLTGNAMTSTVVAAGMLAAFSTFSRFLCSDDADKATQEKEIVVPPKEDCDLIETSADPATSTPLSVGEASVLARQTSALCRCEGEHAVRDKTFHRCRICDHATCLEHGGNLEHYFHVEKNERRRPSQFEDLIKSRLPKLIRFNCGDSVSSKFEKSLDKQYNTLLTLPTPKSKDDMDMEIPEAWKTAMGDLAAAFESTLTLKSITRSSFWEVVYESTHARLVLQFLQHRVQWLLYAKPPQELPLNDAKRVGLSKFPVARLLPKADNLMEGEWELWVPIPVSTTVKLTFEGELIPSFESDRGLASFADTYVFDSFKLDFAEGKPKELQTVGGRYDLKQKCGQAFNSLHVQSSSLGLDKPPQYFHFDHQPQTGDPKTHHYVFTENPKRMPYGAYRQNIAKFSPNFRYPMVRKVSIDGGVQYKFTSRRDILERDLEELEDAADFLNEKPNNRTQYETIYVDGHWQSYPDLSFSPQNWNITVHKKLPTNLVPWNDDSCEMRHKIYECKALIPHGIAESLKRGEWIRLSQKNETIFYQNFLPFIDNGLVAGSNNAPGDGWRPNSSPLVLCPTCSPQRPAILWAWNGNEKSKKKDQKLAQRPFEDPRETFQYGHNLKTRPDAVETMFRISEDDFITFTIGINPQTLIHRAISLLAVDGDTQRVTTSWRISTDDRAASVESFGQYEPKNTADVKLRSELRAMKGKEILRPEQMRSVAWEIEQEEYPKPFTEEEIVEARVPKLGFRLLGRAERPVMQPGGIIASEVGFGKTAAVLSLVHHRKNADSLRMESATTLDGLIPSKATLIFVPDHLVGQWGAEASAFLPDFSEEPTIIAVQKIGALRSKTIQEIQNANIIILPWTLCQKDAYISDLSQAAGMIVPDKSASPRAMTCWYDAALQSIKENVKVLVNAADGPTEFREAIKQKIRNNEKKSKDNIFPVPSKRLTGSAYQDANLLGASEDALNDNANEGVTSNNHFAGTLPNPENCTKSDPPEAEPNPPAPWHTMKNNVLEMFSFARIVVDEFHYADEHARTILAGLRAYSKWLLSGTPNLSKFADIKTMAQLIGINLGVDDYSSMSHDTFQAAIADKTETEKFLIYQPPPSPAWTNRRDELARKFLDQYLRKDKADYGEIGCSSMIRLIHQPAAERAAYIQLEQILADYQLLVLPRNYSNSEADRQIKSCLKGYKKGEEALLWRGSYFNYNILPNEEDDETSQETADTVCKAITTVRDHDFKNLFVEIRSTLKKAEILQGMKAASHATKYKTFLNKLDKDMFGDDEVLDNIKKVLEEVKKELTDVSWKDYFFKEECVNAWDRQMLEPYPEGKVQAGGSSVNAATHLLALTVKKLDGDVHELVKRRRAVRLALDVRKLQGECSPAYIIDCRSCGRELTSASAFILWTCSHIVCEDCKTSKNCPTPRCTARSNPLQTIHGSEFTTRDLIDSHGQVKFSKYGSKIEHLLSLVSQIKEAKDRALVFVQDVNAIEKIQAAFKENELEYATLQDSAKSSNILQQFQSGESPATVLILNIGNASAAGSNITIANHVIFFAPYYTEGSDAQQKFNAAMEQAIGRARRFKQTKDVHVYHLLTSKTFDVDLYEERTRMVVDNKLGTGGRARGADETSVTKTPHCSHLYHMVLGRNQR